MFLPLILVLLSVHAGECAMPLGMVVTGLILPCLWSECELVASQFGEVWWPSNPRGPDRALPFGWGHSSGSSYSSSWARRWKAGPGWHLPERWPLKMILFLAFSFACHLVCRDMGKIKSQGIWKSKFIWFSREITDALLWNMKTNKQL